MEEELEQRQHNNAVVYITAREYQSMASAIDSGQAISSSSFRHVVVFDDGYSMDIELCGLYMWDSDTVDYRFETNLYNPQGRLAGYYGITAFSADDIFREWIITNDDNQTQYQITVAHKENAVVMM